MAREAPPGLRPPAIIVGFLTDWLTTNLLSIPLLIGLGLDPNSQASLDRIYTDPANLAYTTALGLLCTMLGGYVGARLAAGAEMQNAVAVGVASAGAALLLALLGESGPSVWYLALATVLTVGAAALGGLIRLRTRR